MVLFFSECRKRDKITKDPSVKLAFSTDSILFDTVFTTIGSTTKRFKIYNPHSEKVIISDIRLVKGNQSNFRINVDGFPGPSISNVEIAANDSAFVFVQVTVDPNSANTPMVIYDQLQFNTNGNEQKVILEAWGQDAYFHKNEVICGDLTWPTDKPHVIYGLVAVGYPNICEGSSLTIQPGTIVHGHVGGTILTYKSSLNAVGTSASPITFRGDRLEDYLLYDADSVSGQWRGLYFIQANESKIENATIRNAVIGIQVDTLSAGNFVNLNKVKVENTLYSGIVSQGGNIKAENCLFGNAGTNSAIISIGGTAEFNHCTFGNYWIDGIRKDPCLLVQDYYEYNGGAIHRPFTNVLITNSIIYGNIENEVVIDVIDETKVKLDNCLYKQNADNSTPQFFNNSILNQDPLFENNTNLWIFKLKSGSPAINKGNISYPTQLNDDIDGKPRDSQPDLGCYEF